MNAYHNDQAIKDKYLARVSAHAAADEIVKGKYWKDGKGCAVGCTIHSGNHNAYEAELGIPEWLALVEDVIFEGLPNGKSKAWPARFLMAIKPGIDLDAVKAPFLIFILDSTLDKFDHAKFPDVKKSIDDVILLWKMPPEKRAEAAARAAAARAAARARAAEAAAWAAAAWAAAAAEAAAWAEAAWAAEARAAEAAARAAAWAAAAWAAAAAEAARAAEYEKFADRLIELIEGLEKAEK